MQFNSEKVLFQMSYLVTYILIHLSTHRSDPSKTYTIRVNCTRWSKGWSPPQANYVSWLNAAKISLREKLATDFNKNKIDYNSSSVLIVERNCAVIIVKLRPPIELCVDILRTKWYKDTLLQLYLFAIALFLSPT